MTIVQLSPSELSISDLFGRLASDWSPDGKKVAFGAYVPSADSTALYVVDADGTDLHQIVPTATGAVSAQWSPDGEWIAFTSRPRSHPQVWRVHPDGSDLQKLTDGTDGSNSLAPTWSPDGSKLLYAKDEDGVLDTDTVGRWSLWTMNADGTGPTRLTDTTGAEWHWWFPITR